MDKQGRKHMIDLSYVSPKHADYCRSFHVAKLLIIANVQ